MLPIIWSDPALDDLDELKQFIARDRPSIAGSVGRSIAQSIRNLGDLPRRGRPGRVADTRELVLAPLPWIAIYRVDSAAVTILRILHGAQDWPASEGP